MLDQIGVDLLDDVEIRQAGLGHVGGNHLHHLVGTLGAEGLRILEEVLQESLVRGGRGGSVSVGGRFVRFEAGDEPDAIDGTGVSIIFGRACVPNLGDLPIHFAAAFGAGVHGPPRLVLGVVRFLQELQHGGNGVFSRLGDPGRNAGDPFHPEGTPAGLDALGEVATDDVSESSLHALGGRRAWQRRGPR